MISFANFSFFLVILGCLTLAQQAQAGGIDTIDIKIINGSTYGLANEFIKVYGINTPNPLNLPITPSEIAPFVHNQYATPIVNNTISPVWNYWCNFPSPTFTDDSYLVLELWDNGDNPNKELLYLGGSILQISEVKTFEKTFKLGLFDNTGYSPGYVSVMWNHGE